MPARSKPMARGAGLDRRSTLDQGSRSSLKSRSSLPAKSAKRAAEDVPLGRRSDVVRATFERDGYQCVASRFVPGVPCSVALECDEFQGRGREPGSHLDDTKTQTLCALCHRVKTDHPKTAALLGLYGADELYRRMLEGDPADLPAALAEFANLKAKVAGLRTTHGGQAEAVALLVEELGLEIPATAWMERTGS